MKYNWICCCLVFSLNSIALEEPLPEDHECEESINCNLEKSDRAHRCHNPACPNYQKENDKEKPNGQDLQRLAISTLANMAQGILAIGWDPHNPTNVANNVTNIVGNFANFVVQAASNKSLNIEELFANEEFLIVCKKILINNIETAAN